MKPSALFVAVLLATGAGPAFAQDPASAPAAAPAADTPPTAGERTVEELRAEIAQLRDDRQRTREEQAKVRAEIARVKARIDELQVPPGDGG